MGKKASVFVVAGLGLTVGVLVLLDDATGLGYLLTPVEVMVGFLLAHYGIGYLK